MYLIANQATCPAQCNLDMIGTKFHKNIAYVEFLTFILGEEICAGVIATV